MTSHMHAPLLSNISLITEIFVTVSIFYIFYRGYYHGVFSTKLAAITLLYELVFNISYMANRTPSATNREMTFGVMLAIFHGVLSLTMFVALIIFLIIAWMHYRKDINYFKKHPLITLIFLVLWTAAIASGVMYYLIRYII